MWEVIGTTLGLLLALYGAAELIWRLCFCLLLGGCHRRDPILVPVEEEEAEYRLRRLAVWYRLCPNRGFEPIVLLSEENNVLRALCEELHLTVYTRTEWENKNTLQEGQDAVY